MNCYVVFYEAEQDSSIAIIKVFANEVDAAKFVQDHNDKQKFRQWRNRQYMGYEPHEFVMEQHETILR